MTTHLIDGVEALASVTRPAPQFPRRSPAPGEEHRVLVVVRYPLGGIRTHVLYNYPTLAAHGYRFTFAAPADAALDTFAASLRQLEGSEFVGVPARGSHCRLWPAVRRLARGGRFALLHSHGLTAAVHGTLANFGLGLPHVATVHDALRPAQFPGVKGRLKRALLGRLVGRIDTLVPVSDDIRANLLDYLPPLRRRPERLVTIPNGIDAGHYAYAAGDTGGPLRARLGLGARTRLVGFLGRFMEQKGFLPLLDALQGLLAGPPGPPCHLLAVGSGDFEREYRKQVRQRGLGDHITFLDFVPDVRPVLAELDLLVVPSLWEASSVVSMEAMAAGVPVLGTDCIGLREVLRGTPSRMVRAGDPAALCRGLSDALERPWTDEARAFVPEACARFDNAQYARRLLEVFERSLAVR
jgi:glycosyltransferase involved in cell wall biosynthesis